MHLLCGIDESAPGRNAAYVAGALARRLGAALTLLHVVPRDGTTAVLHDLADDVAARTGARVALRVESGSPAERLRAAAADGTYDLVLIGHTRHGRLGDVLLSAVHAPLLKACPVPVIVVPAGASLAKSNRIVLGCRRAEHSHGAARLAGRIAGRLGGPLVLAQVLPHRGRAARPTSWEVYDTGRTGAQAAIAAAGPAVAVRVEYAEYEGEVAERLSHAGDALDAALLVVGEERRSAWRDLLRPSTAWRVARTARRPVLVVPA